MPLCLLLFPAFVACGGAPSVRPATPTASFASAGQVELPGMDADVVAPTDLRPGDVLQLRTVSARPLSVDRLVVDARGFVSVPLAGEVEVSGLPLSAAAAKLEEALRPVDRFGRVMLELTESRGRQAAGADPLAGRRPSGRAGGCGCRAPRS